MYLIIAISLYHITFGYIAQHRDCIHLSPMYISAKVNGHGKLLVNCTRFTGFSLHSQQCGTIFSKLQKRQIK